MFFLDELSLEDEFMFQYYQQQQVIECMIQHRRQQVADRRRAALVDLISRITLNSADLELPEPEWPEPEPSMSYWNSPDLRWPEPEFPATCCEEEVEYEVEFSWEESPVPSPTPNTSDSQTAEARPSSTYSSTEALSSIPGSAATRTRPLSPEAQARMAGAMAKFELSFPQGYSIIPTSGWGLLCGWHSIMHSMEAQYPTLPCPTRDQLQEIFDANTAEYAEVFDMRNSNDFSVDQLAGVLYTWGVPHGLNLQIGYLEEGQAPRLVSHPAEGQDDVRVVWIHNDANWRNPNGVGHYCGMRAKEVENLAVVEEERTQVDREEERTQVDQEADQAQVQQQQLTQVELKTSKDAGWRVIRCL